MLYEVQQTCQKVFIIRRGKLVAADTIENLSNNLGANHSNEIEFELTKIDSDLIGKIKGLDGITSVEQDNNKLYVSMESSNARELSETITKSGSTILLMMPRKYSLEEIFLDFYRED